MSIAVLQVSPGGPKLLPANVAREPRDTGIVMELEREYIEEIEN